MSDTREKLSKLMVEAYERCLSTMCTTCKEFDKKMANIRSNCQANLFADYLIANGVRLEASKQETHGDVIRAMSDEALGAYLCFVINAYHKVCDKCPASSLCSSEGIGLIKWLGLPADPENE